MCAVCPYDTLHVTRAGARTHHRDMYEAAGSDDVSLRRHHSPRCGTGRR